MVSNRSKGLLVLNSILLMIPRATRWDQSKFPSDFSIKETHLHSIEVIFKGHGMRCYVLLVAKLILLPCLSANNYKWWFANKI